MSFLKSLLNNFLGKERPKENVVEKLFGKNAKVNNDKHDTFSIIDFEGLDIENGQIEILSTNVRGDNEAKHYYQNNPKSIADFFAACKFQYEGSLYRCGYDYKLLIFQNGQLLYRMMICFNCGDVIVYNNNDKLTYTLAYEGVDFIELFNKHFSVVIKKDYEFPSRRKGVTLWEEEKNNSTLIQYPNMLPQWLFYQGNYMVWLNANQGVNHNQANDILLEKIKKAIGHSNFNIKKAKEAEFDEERFFGSLVTSNKDVFTELMEKEPSIMPLNQDSRFPVQMNKNWVYFLNFELELFYKE